MLSLSLNNEDGKDLKVLCLGSHSDDLEIGCGGTILKLIEKYRQIEICWVVLSGDQLRAKEARKGAQAFLEHGKDKRVIIKDFKESFFPYIGLEIKEYFSQLRCWSPAGSTGPCYLWLHSHDRFPEWSPTSNTATSWLPSKRQRQTD